MLPTTRITSATANAGDNGADPAKDHSDKEGAPPPAMLACFILMPKQAESLSVLKSSRPAPRISRNSQLCRLRRQPRIRM
jgi:hypothetical protein